MTIYITPILPNAQTQLFIGKELFQNKNITTLIQELGHRAVIISDHVVGNLYGIDLAYKWNAELILIPETNKPLKTRETKEWLEDLLFDKKYGRDTVLIALGGGVITDLVGFLASTYMRGVPLILIPTTLLAMVDAAIGGKTGIDTRHGKNLLGSFYPPKAIIADLAVLKSLPSSEWQNGLAEIIKAALVASRPLWALCKANWREHLEQVIDLAIQVKISTIVDDPLEKGLRRILNFGHTVAHALEASTSYTISHGEAVAIGIMAESYVSRRSGFLNNADFDEIVRNISSSGFLIELPTEYKRAQFLSAMSLDKKVAKGIVRFTLLSKIGKAVDFEGQYCHSISISDVVAMAEWMEGQCTKRNGTKYLSQI